MGSPSAEWAPMLLKTARIKSALPVEQETLDSSYVRRGETMVVERETEE